MQDDRTRCWIDELTGTQADQDRVRLNQNASQEYTEEPHSLTQIDRDWKHTQNWAHASLKNHTYQKKQGLIDTRRPAETERGWRPDRTGCAWAVRLQGKSQPGQP
jgi:hypothetical protein